jgi:polyphosphate kinase
MIDALYRASQAGVDVDLIVRGICCLRPQVAGMSERIRVVSVVGRFLEHSRLFYFHNGDAPEYYLGSADWMPRNFVRRVEAVVPVENQSLHLRLRGVIDVLLRDNRQAWDLHADGTWVQRVAEGEEHATHATLLADSWGAPQVVRVAESSFADRRPFAERGGD